MAPGPDATPDLRAYVLAKQEVTELVRLTVQALPVDAPTEAASPHHDLLVRLAEDRFNLAVVGQFKRGKSTLMNAIIGRDLLPTGVLPLTSAISALCYGPRERALLRRQGWAREQEIGLGELADYVTERGNPGNEKGLIEARVELPSRFLRRGLYFVDTPGVGSGRHENTETTRAFLPQADAVIFVTSVEAPLSEAEELFLVDIREQLGLGMRGRAPAVRGLPQQSHGAGGCRQRQSNPDSADWRPCGCYCVRPRNRVGLLLEWRRDDQHFSRRFAGAIERA